VNKQYVHYLMLITVSNAVIPKINHKNCNNIVHFISFSVKAGMASGSLSASGCRHWPLTPAPAPPPGRRPLGICQNQNEFAERFLGDHWGIGGRGGAIACVAHLLSRKSKSEVSCADKHK